MLRCGYEMRRKSTGLSKLRFHLWVCVLYFTTDLDQAIPDLYYAAQVIAYVFSLASLRRDGRMSQVPNPEIPEQYRFDTDGNLSDSSRGEVMQESQDMLTNLLFGEVGRDFLSRK